MRKKLRLFLSVVVLLGALTHSCAAALQVVNHSFEDGLEAGTPKGWPTIFGNAEFGGPELFLSQEQAKEGKYSLCVVDNDPQGSLGLRSQYIVAEPNKQYQATAQTFVEEGTAQLYLEFWDDKNERIEAHHVGTDIKGLWTPLVVSAKAPAGTKAITLLVYAHLANVGKAYYDVLELEEV